MNLLKSLLKAISVLLSLFLLVFIINKALIIANIKSVDYIEISIWIYLILLLYFFTIFQFSKNK